MNLLLRLLLPSLSRPIKAQGIKDVIDIKGGFVSIAKSTSLVTEKENITV